MKGTLGNVVEADSLGKGHTLASWGGLGAEETAGCLETGDARDDAWDVLLSFWGYQSS